MTWTWSGGSHNVRVDINPTGEPSFSERSGNPTSSGLIFCCPVLLPPSHLPFSFWQGALLYPTSCPGRPILSVRFMNWLVWWETFLSQLLLLLPLLLHLHPLRLLHLPHLHLHLLPLHRHRPLLPLQPGQLPPQQI